MVRISCLEAICVVAIGIATLQLPVGERGARLFSPPPLTWSALKGVVVANNVTAQQQSRDKGNERNIDAAIDAGRSHIVRTDGSSRVRR
jgi:hypothetical protein